MRPSAIFFGTFAALAASVVGQSDQVPPPACLKACMDKTGNCNLCTTSGNQQVQSCISSTCGFRDVSYANAYYGSVCSNGGYQDYSTDPHHFQKVPDSNCTTSAPTSTATNASRDVELAFRA